MQKLVVIGSKGFIGKAVLHFFSLLEGYDCWGCDIVVSHSEPQYFQIDATNSSYSELFENIHFDLCINCAGAASVPDSLINPLKDFSLNVLNVIRILDAIRKYVPNCKFINMSSAAVYGNPTTLPVTEFQMLAPISPYGIHKMQAEQLCTLYYNFWKIKTCSLRIFSAYGPGLKKQLFWDLYQKSLKANMVELFGTGKETRDFIYVDDIVQCIELAFKKAPFKGEAVNVANGYQCTIGEASSKIYDAIGWKGSIKFNNQVRPGDPLNWEADISTIREWGYVNKFDLKSGLEKYAKWLRELE